MQKLYGTHSPFLGGFYLPRAGDSIAVVPTVQDSHGVNGEQDFSMVTLLHEYTHYFVSSTSNLPAPRWLGEAIAEFFSSSGFPSSGGIEIGMPAYHRTYDLFEAQNVTVEQLLDPAYGSDGKIGGDAFYGKSWLLYHYLTLGGKRPGQLDKYVALLAKGEGSLQAGREAFGDFRALDRELMSYLHKPQMTELVIAADKLPIRPVTVQTLSEGMQELMPDVIRTRVGVTPEQAKVTLGDVRQIAAKYPKDTAVQTELAEAECDAGENDAAVATADAVLAIDPKMTRAYYQKRRALFAAKDAKDKDAAYKNAVVPFLALNRIENDDPLPLAYYFRSFVERGAEPSPAAAAGLERAVELVPFDLDLRLSLASYQIGKGNYSAARGNLVPVAYYPEGNAVSDGARALIERIDSGKPPTMAEADKIMKDSEAAAKAKATANGKDGKHAAA